jgi:aquaglyceroporin related protein
MNQLEQPKVNSPSNANHQSSSRLRRPSWLVGTNTTQTSKENANRASRIELAAGQRAQRPQYSLASPFVSHTHTLSYVEPGYYDLNPGYQEVQQTPLWGLAKPLPRVLRPGMRGQQEGTRRCKPDVVKNKQAEVEEPGSSEAIPQVGMIKDQRNDAGKPGMMNEGANTGYRGYRDQDPAKTKSHPVVPRSRSDIVTPSEEKADPMDMWKQDLAPINPTNPFKTCADGDIGEMRAQRLSNIPEPCSGDESGDVRQCSAAHNASNEMSDEVDLENGDAVYWPTEEVEDETRCAVIERDAHNSWSAARAKFREPLAECLAVSSGATLLQLQLIRIYRQWWLCLSVFALVFLL